MDDWRELKLMMRALADITRLMIIYHLARQDKVTVTELAETLKLSQPLVSWHLRKLRRADLIETHRVGRQVYCSLNFERFQQCLQSLEGLIDPNGLLEIPHLDIALRETDGSAED